MLPVTFTHLGHRWSVALLAALLATLLATLLAGWMTIALASPPAPPTPFAAAFALFSQARQGDEHAIAQSVDAFTKLLQADPANPLWMAYCGAATSMRATTTWLPWKKMQYAEDGMALLDRALSTLTSAHSAPISGAVPVAMEVRFVAASTFLAVPGFMNKGGRGAKLLNDILASPPLASAPPAFRGDVWMTAASLAIKEQRMDDARKYFKQVIGAGAPQAEAARAQLGTLPS